MLNYIKVSLDSETDIYLETATDDFNQNENEMFELVASNCKVIEKTKDYFDKTINQIKAFSNNIANSIKNIPASPDELEVEFSVKFSADAGIIISSVSSEASISIKLKWKKSERNL